MIDLVLDSSYPETFDSIASSLTPMIKKTVSSFARDRNLSKIEDKNSLVNLCLMKVHQAVGDFKYEPSLSVEYNERRFIALVKKYITNILIDHQYLASLGIRNPVCGIISISQVGVGNDEDDGEYQLYDKRCNDPYCHVIAAELRAKLQFLLDEEEWSVAELMFDGYTPEEIARKLGMQVSRVRYFIYSRIQPKARSND